MAVPIASDAGLSVGDPMRLFTAGSRSNWYSRSYDVHPDGDRFVIIQPPVESTYLMVIVNWFSELERLVVTSSSGS